MKNNMSDETRMALILNQIQDVWEKHSNLRLCQLLHSAIRMYWETPETEFDIFYIEDDELLKMLKNFTNKTVVMK